MEAFLTIKSIKTIFSLPIQISLDRLISLITLSMKMVALLPLPTHLISMLLNLKITLSMNQKEISPLSLMRKITDMHVMLKAILLLSLTSGNILSSVCGVAIGTSRLQKILTAGILLSGKNSTTMDTSIYG